IKRGNRGAQVVARERHVEEPLRFDVATSTVSVTDTTGAGDAFDAGFLVAWFAARAAGRPEAEALPRATLAGHRAGARPLAGPRRRAPRGCARARRRASRSVPPAAAAGCIEVPRRHSTAPPTWRSWPELGSPSSAPGRRRCSTWR